MTSAAPLTRAPLDAPPPSCPRSIVRALNSAAEHRRLAARTDDPAFRDWYISWARKQIELARWFNERNDKYTPQTGAAI